MARRAEVEEWQGRCDHLQDEVTYWQMRADTRERQYDILYTAVTALTQVELPRDMLVDGLRLARQRANEMDVGS